jgi:TP901 family phage tail tape measure protein
MAGLGSLGALGGTAFTIMAVVEAVDSITEPFEKMNETVSSFTDTLREAAGNADGSGADIQAMLLETASGADALAVAEARLTAAENDQAEALERQAAAEKSLLSAMEEFEAAADGDVTAATALSTANKALADASTEAATATKALGDAQKLQSDTAYAQAVANGEVGESSSSLGDKLSSAASTVGKVGLVMDAAGGLAVDMAAKYQTATTVLATSGGETAGSIIQVQNGMVNYKGTLAQVQTGLLSLAASTGTATQELVNGMYLAGSAGYTGAAGLNVMQAAAEGAKAENADLGTVTNAMTTVMTDYGISAKSAALNQSVSNGVMNQMIAVVSRGKTTTEALAGALSTVLPEAAQAKISFGQVGGAMATMTAQGVSAQESANLLSNAITSLENPNSVAVNEMQQLGVQSTQVQKDLGKQGLTGTYEELSNAITSHMGPSGTVIQNAFQNATNAGADMNTMLTKMSPNVASLAKQYAAGSINTKQWQQDLYGVSGAAKTQLTEFAADYDQTQSFNSLLKSGSPAAQTYQQAMEKMTGGATGLKTALYLTGGNMTTFQKNVAAVTKAGTSATSSVAGWSEVQGTFNQKIDEAKESLDTTAISIGTALLPAVTKLMDGVIDIVKPLAEWTQGHQKVTMYVVAGAAALFTLVGAINLAVKAVKSVQSAFNAVNTVVSKAIGLFTKKAETDTKAAESSEEAAGAAEEEAEAERERQAAIEELIASMEEETGVTEEQQAAIDGLIASCEELGAALDTAGADMDVLMAAQEEAVGAAEELAVATEEVDVAMDANPIGLIIIAIVALVAAFVLLWNHCAAFRDFWKDAWNIIKDAAELAWDYTKAIFDDMVDVIKAVWVATIATFDAIKDGIVDAVSDIVSWVESHWELLIAIITGPIGIIVASVIKYWSDITSGISNAINDIVSWVKSHWVLLVDIITGPIGIVVTTIIKYWSDIKQWFQDGVNDVSSILNWFGSLPGKFANWLGGVVTSVSHGVQNVLNWFGQLPGKIMNLLADADTWLVSTGENIIKGMEHGLDNMVGDLESKVKGLGGDVVGWAKDALSILSPSKVMADEVGKYIPMGIAQGIEDNVGSIQAAVKTAAATTVSTAQQALNNVRYTGAGLPTQGLGAQQGTATYINLDMRGTQMMTERDMGTFVNKMGSALTKYILPQGGLRVGYPRG